MDLNGQSALVTGGSSGLGAAVARALAAAGARVAINYRSGRAPAEELAAEVIAAGGDAFAVAADVSDEGAVDAMVEETVDRFGRIDILVCNSGLQQDARFDDMTLDALAQGDRRQPDRSVPVLPRRGSPFPRPGRAAGPLAGAGQDRLHELGP